MSKKMEVLRKIESGELTPDEGAKLIENLDATTVSGNTPPKSDLDILSLIESGEITPDEGILKLKENKSSAKPEPINEEIVENTDEEVIVNFLPSGKSPISEEEVNKWKNIWQIPLYVGLVITMLSASWMNGVYQANQGINFWFFFAMLPLFLGIFLLVISWNSQNGPWIHIRIKEKNQNIAISFPLFINLTGNLVRKFGVYITQIPNANIDELADAIDDLFSSDNPLEINVNNKKDNEQVKIYIG